MAKSQTPQRREFSDDFKRDAVQQAIAPGANIRAVAREIGIVESVLRRWMKERKAGIYSDGATEANAPAQLPESPVSPPPVGEMAMMPEVVNSVAIVSRRRGRGRGHYIQLAPEEKAKAIQLVLDGQMSGRQAAAKFRVADSTVLNWVKKARQAAEPTARAIPASSRAEKAKASGDAETIRTLRNRLAVAERYIGKMALENQLLRAAHSEDEA